MRLDHIQLAIPQGSENKCRQFWIGCLHFEEIEKPEPLRARGGAWFLKDTLEVHLGVETPFSAAQKAHPGIATDGLHTLADKLQKHGYSVQWDRSILDRDRFFTTDPVENRIEFLGDT